MILGQGERQPREILLRIGPAGSGKTRRCIEELIAREAAGRPGLYLVPEQSTYLADRLILEPPGPQALRHVRVVSFRRLAHLLEERPAGLPSPVIDPSARRVLLRSLFGRLSPALQKPYAPLVDRPGFIETLAAAIREIRLESGDAGGAPPGGAEEASRLPEPLRAKLACLMELKRLYEDALAARGERDPELVLLATPSRIRSLPEMFRGLPVLVDGFLSFTHLETDILMALAGAGANLTITLCIDAAVAAMRAELAPEPPAFRLRGWPAGFLARVGRPVFLGPLATLAQIEGRARAAGWAVRVEAAPAASGPPRFRSRDLARIEASALRQGEPEGDRRAPADVEAIAARDPSHEVEVWAKRIDRWIRLDPEPVRPGEVAVILRDLEPYRSLIEETFARYAIPVFVDRTWDIASRPLVRTILDALDVLRNGWPREAVIGFLRSPLLGARGGEIDLLENLSLEGGYDYEGWTGEDWPPVRRPPRTRYARGDEERAEAALEGEGEAEGAAEEEIEEEEAAAAGEEEAVPREIRLEQARAAIANRLRARYLGPLRSLGERWWAGAIPGPEAVAALRDWIAASGVRERALSATDVPEADAAREAEAVDRVLSQIGAEAAAEPFTLDAFARLLRAGLSSLTLGRTPTGLDRVTVAEVQRSRLGEVRRAIVGGLTAADFPRAVAGEGFFNEGERTRLAEMGIDLGAPQPMRQEEEAYLFYIAVTRASERLVLTRPSTDLEGASLEPSPFLREIRGTWPELEERLPGIEEDPAAIEDAQTAEELAARVGAYLAARLDRRRSGMRREPAADRSAGDDRRILTAYNRLLEPAPAPGGGARPFLEASSRMWGYDNRPALPEPVTSVLFAGGVIPASVARLEAFARCPYQHFARHMLRLRPRAQAEVTPLENGLLAHKALEVLYREGPLPTDAGLLQERLERVLASIAGDESLYAYQVDPSGGFRWRTAGGQLLRFLDLEARRLAASSFVPKFFEAEFGTARRGALAIPLAPGVEIALRGRIDRIDVAEIDGETRALVVDYKSRPPISRGRPKDVDEGLDLQLAVYLLVVREVLGMAVIGGLYVPVLPKPASARSKDEANPLGIKLGGLLPEESWALVQGGLSVLKGSRPRLETHEELERLLERARATVALYGRAIRGGAIDVAPVKTGSRPPCEACEFRALCRVDPAYNPFRRSPREGLEEKVDPGRPDPGNRL